MSSSAGDGNLSSIKNNHCKKESRCYSKLCFTLNNLINNLHLFVRFLYMIPVENKKNVLLSIFFLGIIFS